MPGLNGTGPLGKGPGTGGRRGTCFGGALAADKAAGQRGAGRGNAPRGGGRGRAYGGGRGPAQADTVEALKDRAAVLERELAAVRSRIAAHETDNG